MKDKEIVTVDYLLKILKRVSEAGYGDMTIKCADGFLHDDEITVNYRGRQFELNGMIYNTPVFEKMINFCNTVEQAKAEFLDIKTN